MEYSNIYENNIILICIKINVLLKFLLIIFIINFLYLSFNYPKKKILHLQIKKRIKQLIEGKNILKYV
jgi:hypothetical protein